MLCNPISYYPDKVDELIFFQDNSLEKEEFVNNYNHLISQGKYTEANDYLNQQKDVYGYFADFFNLLENRIYHLQNHLLTKKNTNPFVSSDEEPSSVTQDTIWI